MKVNHLLIHNTAKKRSIVRKTIGSFPSASAGLCPKGLLLLISLLGIIMLTAQCAYSTARDKYCGQYCDVVGPLQYAMEYDASTPPRMTASEARKVLVQSLERMNDKLSNIKVTVNGIYASRKWSDGTIHTGFFRFSDYSYLIIRLQEKRRVYYLDHGKWSAGGPFGSFAGGEWNNIEDGQRFIEAFGTLKYYEKDLAIWEPYQKTNTIEAYEEFIAKYPNNSYRAEATTLLEDMRAYKQVKARNTIEAYEEFIAKYPESIYRVEATALLENMRAYQQLKSLNTLQAYAEFLRAHPSSPNRREALKSMSLLIRKQKDSYDGYKKFIVEFQDGMEFVPPSYHLALIGPEGMRVHDLIRLLKQGIKDTVIAAKIRMQNAVYKDFDFGEIGTLKKMGMTDVLIEAMLDSTTRAKRAQEELLKKKEMEDLLAEIQRTQKKLDTMKAAQERQQQQPQATASERQDSGPSLGDTVKNCAARIAALEACRHLSGFAQSICKATAKSQFPCQE